MSRKIFCAFCTETAKICRFSRFFAPQNREKIRSFCSYAALFWAKVCGIIYSRRGLANTQIQFIPSADFANLSALSLFSSPE